MREDTLKPKARLINTENPGTNVSSEGKLSTTLDLATKIVHPTAVGVLDIIEHNLNFTFGFELLGEIDLDRLAFLIPLDCLDGD